MSVEVVLRLNGVPAPLLLDDEALAAIAAALPREPVDEPEFCTIPEAAEVLRARRHRIDDLLSAGRLTRHKDGARTLVSRAELPAYLNGGGR